MNDEPLAPSDGVVATAGTAQPEGIVLGSVDVAEIKALIAYVSGNGLDPDGAVLKPVLEALCEYEEAPRSSENATSLLMAYSRLSKATVPVTGRSLLKTPEVHRFLRPIMGWALFFFLFAAANEAFEQWALDALHPEGGFWYWVAAIQTYCLDLLVPFVWGGLGSCIYLLKLLNDKAHERSFDDRLLKGWGSRIWLGAVLGAIVLYIYDPSKFTGEDIALDAKAVAFLTGVGVKVVYGAIEKTVATLAAKMNLSALRTDAAQGAGATRAFLVAQLAQAGSTGDEDAKKAIVQLIERLELPDKGIPS
jgi:hypothetical protein